MTINEQWEHFRNIQLDKGEDSKEAFEDFQKACRYWLVQGEVGIKFSQEEFNDLKKNYDWVCNRLKELENE